MPTLEHVGPRWHILRMLVAGVSFAKLLADAAIVSLLSWAWPRGTGGEQRQPCGHSDAAPMQRQPGLETARTGAFGERPVRAVVASHGMPEVVGLLRIARLAGLL